MVKTLLFHANMNVANLHLLPLILYNHHIVIEHAISVLIYMELDCIKSIFWLQGPVWTSPLGTSPDQS